MPIESTPRAPGAPTLTCDGQGLKQAARAGLAWLEKHYEKVNALNVFPVPDGDTGTNMLLTMRSAWKEIANSEETHAARVAKLIYNGALMGARGNSGVILSQLWRGFSQGIENEETLDASALVLGLEEATRTAYRAVQEPVEGTILTVAREIAEEAALAVQADSDIRTILSRVVERGQRSVEQTPELLAVLREAGVVDAGGMGLALILEGMLRYLTGEPLDVAVEAASAVALQSALEPEDDLGYGYDVQFLLKGQDLDIDQVRQDIEAMGVSTLVVGDESLIKVHVHVHNPGVPLGYGAERGVLLDVVVENMQEQYQEFVQEGGPRVIEEQEQAASPITLPTVEPGTIAAVTVAPGEGLTRIFYSMGAAHVVPGGQTMNPSTEDFVEAINTLPTDKIVVLPNNKNILLSANAAAGLVNGKDVRVVPTTTIPQGLSALLSLDPTGDLDAVADSMKEVSEQVETGEVTTATRNVTLNGVKVRQGQVIGLHNDVLRVAGNEVNDVVVDLLREMGADQLELVSLYYGAGVNRRDAEALVGRLTELYPNHEIELQSGGQAHYFYILSAE
jgi:DAK2 domain fusion protein YloV